MISIKYIYNKSKRNVTYVEQSELNFQTMERDVRRRFSVGSKPLFFFYVDVDGKNVLILDEEEFFDIRQKALSQLEPFCIHLNHLEKLIQVRPEPDYLQRIFVSECMRHQPKNRFVKKRLISDLQSIKESIIRAAVKSINVRHLLQKVSKEVQMHFVEAIFEHGENEEDDNNCHCEMFENEVSPSFSSILDQQTAMSFISKGESPFLYEIGFSDMQEIGEEDSAEMPSAAKNQFAKFEPLSFCRNCKANVQNKMRFECDRCPRLILCEACHDDIRHKHKMKPVFFVNDSKQKITAMLSAFKKIKQNHQQIFFTIMKAFWDKSPPG